MAGDPILYADNCAFIIADEPCRRKTHEEHALTEVSKILDLAAAIGAPFFDMRTMVKPDTPFAIDDALMREIGSLKRSSLVIVGGLLEGVVTQLSMSALLDGFDVFIPADLLLSGDPDREDMYLTRIRAVSGIVVTSRQITLELMLREKDPNRREAVRSIQAALFTNS